MQPKELEWCNWSFDECLSPYRKWLVKRDCQDETITLTRGDSRNWKAHQASLKPQVQTRYQHQIPGAECPNCGKQVNGVNQYDDGETWRR